MAITTFGYSNADITVEGFSKISRYAAEIGYRHGVAEGFNATLGAGLREVVISSGIAITPGKFVQSDAPITVTHAVNPGSSNRVDWIVLETNETTKVTSVKVVQGTSSTAPALTQVEADIWQMPLARVTMRPDETFDVVPCKPLPRMIRVLKGDVAGTTIAYNDPATAVSTVAVGDPGWPYHLQVSAEAGFALSTGFAIMQVIAGGVTFGPAKSARLDIGGTVPVYLNDTTTVPFTGPVSARLQIVASGMSSGDSLTLGAASSNHFTVTQIPA